MKVTCLGQAGLLSETDGLKIVVDPCLSDSAAKVNPKDWRRVPADKGFLQIKPDVPVCTHNHLGPETLKHYLVPGAKMTVLSMWGCLRR